MLLLLHSAFLLSVLKLLLKGEVGGRALNSHGNYIVNHRKSWKNHGIVFFNFCWNPVMSATDESMNGLSSGQLLKMVPSLENLYDKLTDCFGVREELLKATFDS